MIPNKKKKKKGYSIILNTFFNSFKLNENYHTAGFVRYLLNTDLLFRYTE